MMQAHTTKPSMSQSVGSRRLRASRAAYVKQHVFLPPGAQPPKIPLATMMSGLGAGEASDVDSLSMAGYSLATVAGSVLSGGLVGLVAARSKDGALRGAMLTGGLAGIVEGRRLFDTNPVTAAALGLAGLLSAGMLAYSFVR
jgi:hypothetical protein